MNENKTTLERAFELAGSGKCASMDELTRMLKAEGYASGQLVGPSLRKQLLTLIRDSIPQS